MEPGWWVYGLVLAVATGLTLLLTPVAMRLGVRWGLVAIPGGRRKHKGIIPVTGALAIFPAFVCAALLPVALGVQRVDSLELTRLIGILVGLGVVWLTGVLDDRFHFHFLPQFVGLLLAALIAILFKVFIELFNNPFTDAQIQVEWYVMAPLTMVWIVGITGTVNVLDGLDGLATGVTAIAAAILFVHMLRLQQYSVSLLPLALLGCCLGFLVFNSSPARIFLGGGAYLLGYALATISIVSGAKVATALLVLWPAILDVLWQGYARWKRGQSLGLGDRGHLHFRLFDLGWPQNRIVLLYYAITALLGTVALLSPSRLLKLVVLGGVSVLLAILFIMLTRRHNDEDPEAGR